MGNFKFGVSLRTVDSSFVGLCRRAEELGYDAISVPDHLGAGRPAPFPALVAAAAATSRPRVGTLVSNLPFYNVALFARDVANTWVLTGGRLELGLGSGHMKSEFDEAGLPWLKAADRIAYLRDGLAELRSRLGADLPPLLIAGNSDGVLSLAASDADIVGFAGLRQAPGKPPGTFVLDPASAMDARVAYFRSLAGGREIEYNMLVQRVVVTDDRRAAAAEWQALTDPEPGVDELLEAPQLLLGTVDEIVTQLVERRERYGFSYITVFDSMMETLAPVVARLRGR
ncbi:TIGR03621 family F420-dependent LLM class oxidoreductase [Amycolatopsis sp. DSM 110486]|uniref:TIGR03621 family F420-dependent LLM class oxidoreductase n=1 Tax=Amycolatopsis sp. DSM 110486 TaxID=2865832 RepID=UPI001C6A69BD|nr:TIGR03621 family F420-dependent LLM class oxidoreductase [Amycolatopsis sp. DSM 110486]QYN23079.1 TIGR03621 family F420-dependent LLM class oxidoreductase [Amycolatopsis sp. DSM 110486]